MKFPYSVAVSVAVVLVAAGCVAPGRPGATSTPEAGVTHVDLPAPGQAMTSGSGEDVFVLLQEQAGTAIIAHVTTSGVTESADLELGQEEVGWNVESGGYTIVNPNGLVVFTPSSSPTTQINPLGEVVDTTIVRPVRDLALTSAGSAWLLDNGGEVVSQIP